MDLWDRWAARGGPGGFSVVGDALSSLSLSSNRPGAGACTGIAVGALPAYWRGGGIRQGGQCRTRSGRSGRTASSCTFVAHPRRRGAGSGLLRFGHGRSGKSDGSATDKRVGQASSSGRLERRGYAGLRRTSSRTGADRARAQAGFSRAGHARTSFLRRLGARRDCLACTPPAANSDSRRANIIRWLGGWVVLLLTTSLPNHLTTYMTLNQQM